MTRIQLYARPRNAAPEQAVAGPERALAEVYAAEGIAAAPTPPASSGRLLAALRDGSLLPLGELDTPAAIMAAVAGAPAGSPLAVSADEDECLVLRHTWGDVAYEAAELARQAALSAAGREIAAGWAELVAASVGGTSLLLRRVAAAAAAGCHNLPVAAQAAAAAGGLAELAGWAPLNVFCIKPNDYEQARDFTTRGTRPVDHSAARRLTLTGAAR